MIVNSVVVQWQEEFVVLSTEQVLRRGEMRVLLVLCDSFPGLTQTAATAFLQVVESNKNIHARFSGLMQKDLWDVLGAMDGAESKNFLQRDYSNPPTDPTGLKGNAAGVKSYNNRSGRG